MDLSIDNSFPATVRSLLKEFSTTNSRIKRRPTFLELSGYPHYEQVCSNLLRFFFDTNEPHGLQNLLLKSLLECIGRVDLIELCADTANVQREELTRHGKRIDLVIECQNVVLAIENKIFHWLHNDLNSYSAHIHGKYYQAAHKVFVVLSPRPENVEGTEFISITFREFFATIKRNLGEYAIVANSRYLSYFLDFIESIENLFNKKPMNTELFNLLADNYEVIEDLQREYKKLEAELYDTVRALESIIPEKGEGVVKWIWNKWVLVHDIKLHDNYPIAVDCSVNFKETTIEIFDRKPSTNWIYLESLKPVVDAGKELRKTDRGYIIYERDIPFYEHDLEALAGILNQVIDQLTIRP